MIREEELRILEVRGRDRELEPDQQVDRCFLRVARGVEAVREGLRRVGEDLIVPALLVLVEDPEVGRCLLARAAPGERQDQVAQAQALVGRLARELPAGREDLQDLRRLRELIEREVDLAQAEDGRRGSRLVPVLEGLGNEVLDYPMEELSTLKLLGTRLQGHPAAHLLPGIEGCTGSLGQGLSFANGMALGFAHSRHSLSRLIACWAMARRKRARCGRPRAQPRCNACAT